MKIGMWVTGKELMDRWGIQDFELLGYVKSGFRPYSQALMEAYEVDPSRIAQERKGTFRIQPKGMTCSGVEKVHGYSQKDFNPNTDLVIPDWSILFEHIHNCLFRKEDVEKFEGENPELNKLKGNEMAVLTGKDVQEYGRLKQEKKVWDSSIEATVAAMKFCYMRKPKEITKSELFNALDSYKLSDRVLHKIWNAIRNQTPFTKKAGRPKSKI